MLAITWNHAVKIVCVLITYCIQIRLYVFLCSFYFQLNFCTFFYILIREGIRFMQNLTPSFFIKSPRFGTPVRKNGFWDGVCLSVCIYVCLFVCMYVCLLVYTITFERIDRLDWPLVHLFSVKN